MKYSQLIGLLACIGEIVICFMPWIVVAEKNLMITGMNAAVPDFGKPGLLNIVLSGIMMLLFIIPTIWAKRTNVVIAAINLAWSLRNYLLLSLCHAGECPQKKAGLYLLLCLSVLMLIMTFLPSIKVEPKKQ